jgi:hypothetical protein
MVIKQLLVSSLVVLVLAVTGASAATVPDRIIFKIGDAPPGTHDIAGRIIAKHLPKHLEARAGKPVEVVVENVGGSAGIVLLKQVSAMEQSDGSVMAFGNPLARTVSYLVNNATLDFDPTKISFVAGISRSVPLCLALRDRLPDPATMRIGYTSKTGTPFLNAKVASILLGPGVTLIGGFKALEELPAAMERKEIDAYCGLTFDTFRREKRDKELQIIYRVTEEAPAGLENVPSLVANLSPELAPIVPLLLSGNRYFQTVYLPPGVDPALRDLYRAAFSDLAADEAFQTDLKNAVITLTFANGAEVEAFRQQLIDTDPALWKKAQELIAPPN